MAFTFFLPNENGEGIVHETTSNAVITVPDKVLVWEKYTSSIEEATEYFRIGTDKLQQECRLGFPR